MRSVGGQWCSDLSALGRALLSTGSCRMRRIAQQQFQFSDSDIAAAAERFFLGDLANSLSCRSAGLRSTERPLPRLSVASRLDPFDTRLPFGRVLLLRLTGICIMFSRGQKEGPAHM